MTALVLHCVEDRSAAFVDVFRKSAIAAGWTVALGPPPPTLPPGFARLIEVYRHLSPNSPAFELACFRRYFEVARRIGLDDRVVIADSDLFVQAGPSELPAELLDPGTVCGSIGIDHGRPEADISPHFSFWTGAMLKRFTDYVVAAYESGSAALAALHAARVAVGGVASISDMTLFHRWVHADGVAFIDTNRVFGDRYIDHNISMAECRDARFAPWLGRKALRFGPRGVTLRTDEGLVVRPIVLHLQGQYKLAAPSIARGDAVGLAAVSAYIRAGRLVRGLRRAR